MTLAEFLLARFVEDAERVDTEPEFVEIGSARGPGWGNRGSCPICGHYQFDGTESVTGGAWWEHVETYHQRTRVLAECEAKRRIVAEHPHRQRGLDGRGGDDEWECTNCTDNTGWWCATLRLLALPYADHQDYREEWRP